MTRDEQADFYCDVLKAVAHPGRIKMIRELEGGERCVWDLQEVVGSDISTVSKHLAVLRNKGIVKTRRDGQQILYSIAMPCVLNLFRCIDTASASQKAAARRRGRSTA